MPGTEYIGKEEEKSIKEVLETKCFFRYNHEHIRNDVWKAKEMEGEAKKFTGAKYAHAVSSGSTAVQTILSASGIGFGDEVIVPTFTYIAPIECLLLNGALPVFAEIDTNLCLNGSTIEEAITEKTKAVLVVHMCGAAADMDSIMDVCKRNNLTLIEDAGQAFGASYKGTSVGLFGKAGAFSFDFFKLTTSAEGGLCITNNKEIYETIDRFSDHGHTHVGSNRGMEQHPIFGSNYRISELHAAIGAEQIKKATQIRQDKRDAKRYITENLKFTFRDEIKFRDYSDISGDSATFLNFFLPSEKQNIEFHKSVSKKKLMGFNHWYTNMYHYIKQWEHIKNLSMPMKLAIHHLGAPQDYNNLELPKSDDIMSRLVSLGIKGKWKENEIENFTDNLIKTLKEVL